ncbi:MAG: POTRA domain-containing protein, partial [Tistlia sp.]
MGYREGGYREGAEGPAPAGAQQIRVAAFAIEGNVRFTDAVLSEVLAPFAGRDVTLEELRQAVEAVLGHYREYGYRATRVSLPPQRIEQGVVRLVVEDGTLDRAMLAEAVRGDMTLALPAPTPSAAWAPAAGPAPAVSRPAPAPAFAFYRSLPSSRTRATLLNAETPAADRLVVELEEGSVLGFRPESDLFARLPEGGWQVGATFQMSNPAGRGGHLQARGVTDGAGAPFFSGRFDAPLDLAGSTLAGAESYLDEERVDDLDGRRADGQATLLEIVAERPLLQGGNFDLSLRTRLRHLEQLDQAQGTTTADRRIDSAQVGARGRLRDSLLGGGTTAASLSATLGHTDLDGYLPYARSDAEGARTAGSFARFRASLARLQTIGGPWSLFGSLMAQGASKNLDGSQQFSIGGLPPERGFA